jgi:hypothetical protein
MSALPEQTAGSRASALYFNLNSAPPNGVGTDILARAYKHLTPGGVKENYDPLLLIEFGYPEILFD